MTDENTDFKIECLFSQHDGKLKCRSFSLNLPTLIAGTEIMEAFAAGNVAQSSDFEFPDSDMLPVLGVYFDDTMNALVVYESDGKTNTLRLMAKQFEEAVRWKLIKNGGDPDHNRVVWVAMRRQENRRIGIHYASIIFHLRKKVESLRKGFRQFKAARIAYIHDMMLFPDEHRAVVSQVCPKCLDLKVYGPTIREAPARFRQLADMAEAFLKRADEFMAKPDERET